MALAGPSVCLFLQELDTIALDHPKLLKRVKDCARVLRKCERQGRVMSLRVNYVPLAQSVACCGEHHGDDNWVDDRIEAAWAARKHKGGSLCWSFGKPTFWLERIWSLHRRRVLLCGNAVSSP